jgi:DedD protein
MGLTSIFQRKPGKKAAAVAADAPADLVQEARARARRRLIGAVVLVVIGVIGFPLLFETQPRPISVDIPIEIPRKETAAPLVMPAPTRAIKPVTPAPAEAASSAAAPQVVTETQADAGREVAPAAPPVAKPASAGAKPAPAAASVAKPAPATVAKTPPAEKEPAPKDPTPKEGGRFVVQVGAFADSAAARETRQKVEKLGLKTYTQVAETSQGSRIRVRVGPFASREEADRVQAKLKAAGSPAVVLTL